MLTKDDLGSRGSGDKERSMICGGVCGEFLVAYFFFNLLFLFICLNNFDPNDRRMSEKSGGNVPQIP